MNKIEKLLQKLDPKTRKRIEKVLTQVFIGNLDALDIKKLKGSEDFFRARVGDYRIIFKQSDGEIRLLDITKRDEKTYKDY